MGRPLQKCPQPPSPTISDAVIVQMPHLETNADLDLQPSLHETTRDVQQFSSTKAFRSIAIPAEIHKHVAPNLWITSQRPSRRCGDKVKTSRTSSTLQEKEEQQDKCHDMRIHLLATSVNPTKAFDTYSKAQFYLFIFFRFTRISRDPRTTVCRNRSST
ncbi:hypothetical protein SprV_0200860700 [Sparganum proliferum]